MKVLKYDEVLLFDGRKGIVVEVLSDKDFSVDIGSTPEDAQRLDVRIDEIEKVISSIG